MTPITREFERIRPSKPRHNLHAYHRERRRVIGERTKKWRSESHPKVILVHRDYSEQWLDTIHRLAGWSYLGVFCVVSGSLVVFLWYGLLHGLRIV